MKAKPVIMVAAMVFSGHANARELSPLAHEGIVTAPLSEVWASVFDERRAPLMARSTR